MGDQRVSLPSKREPEISPQRESALSSISTGELAAQCLKEIDRYRRSEPSRDEYALELLHRAMIQGEQEAWVWMLHCFSGFVLGWLHRHPNRTVACRLESEENYVTQTFARFLRATTLTKHMEFSTLAAALQYLRACLNGTILDTLRAYARPREIALPEPGEVGEPHMEDASDSNELWEALRSMLSDRREQRLAYLFFHCGLKPREVVRFCPQEFRDIHEIYRLRRSMMERLLRNAEQLRWRLG
ncbi:MAG TPA: hypothetical protein VGT82_00910 [Ktedonobacteraceae bacterium]|nr:hypothetical protein [Ktedonobacteraceae bacterium]